MRECTKCSAEIRKGDPYRTTKRGDHHQNCAVATKHKCGRRVTAPKGFVFKLRCKENDNFIRFKREDRTVGEPLNGEFQFADPLGRSWAMIGLDDMLDALRLAEIGVKK